MATDRQNAPPVVPTRKVVGERRSNQQNRNTNKNDRKQSCIDTAAVYSGLAIFSIAGTATRIGLTALTTYDGQPVFGVLAAQAVGCAVMGLLVRRKAQLDAIHPAVHVVIGTGFCGSTTTFSTWMFETFQAFSNNQGYRHSGLKNATSGITQLYVTLAVAAAALRFGRHTSSFLRASEQKIKQKSLKNLENEVQSLENQPMDEKLRHKPQRAVNLLRWSFLVLAIPIWLCPILLAIFRAKYRHITLALALAPFGTFLRYFLARKANSRNKDFPIGTFSANILACAILAVVGLLQRTGSTHGNAAACSALQGVADGICGCLSTVSTFAVETNGLSRRHAYRYVVVSILTGQAIIVIVYGSYWWSHGLQPACSFNTA